MEKLNECPVCGDNNLINYITTKDYFLSREEFHLSRCVECGLIFTNPRPSPNELAKYYNSDNYLSHHAGGFSPVHRVYQLLRHINIQNKYRLVSSFVQKGRILDVGCGTGEFLNYFQKRDWEVMGIEPNGEARKFAMQSYGFSVADELELQSLTAESFEVISLWHVLEHVPNLNKRMVELKKLLNPNGVLIVALPNLASADAAYYGSMWAGLDVPRHLYHFTPDSFLNLANRHGFKLIQTVPMKMDAFYVSMLSEQYKESCCGKIRAIIRGLLSNLKAQKSKQYSSMIYVLKK